MNCAWPTAQIAVMGAKGAVEIIFRSDIGDTDAVAARTRRNTKTTSCPLRRRRTRRTSTTSSCRTRQGDAQRARALAMLRDKKVQKMPAKKHDNLPL